MTGPVLGKLRICGISARSRPSAADRRWFRSTSRRRTNYCRLMRVLCDLGEKPSTRRVPYRELFPCRVRSSACAGSLCQLPRTPTKLSSGCRAEGLARRYTHTSRRGTGSLLLVIRQGRMRLSASPLPLGALSRRDSHLRKSSSSRLAAETVDRSADNFNEAPGIFAAMDAMPHAVESLQRLADLCGTYTVSTTCCGKTTRRVQTSCSGSGNTIGRPAYKRPADCRVGFRVLLVS